MVEKFHTENCTGAQSRLFYFKDLNGCVLVNQNDDQNVPKERNFCFNRQVLFRVDSGSLVLVYFVSPEPNMEKQSP